jgi:hypothetical protein
MDSHLLDLYHLSLMNNPEAEPRGIWPRSQHSAKYQTTLIGHDKIAYILFLSPVLLNIF